MLDIVYKSRMVSLLLFGSLAFSAVRTASANTNVHDATEDCADKGGKCHQVVSISTLSFHVRRHHFNSRRKVWIIFPFIGVKSTMKKLRQCQSFPLSATFHPHTWDHTASLIQFTQTPLNTCPYLPPSYFFFPSPDPPPPLFPLF